MRSNEDWKIAVKAKIDEVLANANPTEYPPPASLPATIDHTLLKPDATPAQIDTLCDEAIKYGFKVYKTPSFLFFLSWKRGGVECFGCCFFIYKLWLTIILQSCCVNGSYIPQVAKRLQGVEVIPCAVVGFPLGAMKPSAKAL